MADSCRHGHRLDVETVKPIIYHLRTKDREACIEIQGFCLDCNLYVRKFEELSYFVNRYIREQEWKNNNETENS